MSAIVHTTAEIVIGDALHLAFSRRMDPATGFKELVISKRSLSDDQVKQKFLVWSLGLGLLLSVPLAGTMMARSFVTRR